MAQAQTNQTSVGMLQNPYGKPYKWVSDKVKNMEVVVTLLDLLVIAYIGCVRVALCISMPCLLIE